MLPTIANFHSPPDTAQEGKKRLPDGDHSLHPFSQKSPLLSVPQINGARIFGVRPGSPVQFRICATGAGPLSFDATHLPMGLTIDHETGIFSGSVNVSGDYRVWVHVASEYGEATAVLTIKVGQEICLTPPMGWNSWYANSDGVSEASVRAAASAMVESGLAAHGWSYINLDDCWQGERGGKFHAIQPNEKFGDMKQLCDDLHALGLKVGIYSTPWIGSYAGFVGGSAPNSQADYSRFMLPETERKQPGQVFGGYPAIRTNGVGKIGEHWFFDRDVAQWVEWGIDFVKVDWNPNDVPTAQRIAADLGAASRDIVYSISNAADLNAAADLAEIANLWRTTGDIFDNWESVSGVASAQVPWQPFCRPGHWNDPDMLQVGSLGITNGADGKFYPTKLTQNEQIFQMSLWCLLSAPLFVSCNLATLDDFTLALLTNDEIISIDQDAAGQPARHCCVEGGDLWTKLLSDGTVAVGLFNLGQADCVMQVKWEQIGLSGPRMVRNLWERSNKGVHDTMFSATVKSHGAVMLRLLEPAPVRMR